MKLAGIQKLTLLDFPGRTAATVFTPGCNFRCPFCHNADLVLGAKKLGESAPHSTAANPPAGTPRQKASGGSLETATIPTYPVEDFFAFLDKRKGLLDGVCITGGEPTLQPDLAEFCAEIHERGFQVKLDTNGSQPDRLRQLTESGTIDYVAMDVKNAPERYAETIGAANFDIEPIRESVRILSESGIPHEFRTTVVHELHTAEDLMDIAFWLAASAPGNNVLRPGAIPEAADEELPERPSLTDESPWFLQSFVDSESVLEGKGQFHAWSKQNLQAILPRLRSIFPQTTLRGVE